MYIRHCLKCLCVLLIDYNPKFDPFIIKCHFCEFIMKFNTVTDELELYIPDNPAKTYSIECLPVAVRRELEKTTSSTSNIPWISFTYFEKDYAVIGKMNHTGGHRFRKKLLIRYLIREDVWQFSNKNSFNKWQDSVQYFIHDNFMKKVGISEVVRFIGDTIYNRNLNEEDRPQELIVRHKQLKVVN